MEQEAEIQKSQISDEPDPDNPYPFVSSGGKRYRRLMHPNKQGDLVPAREYESGLVTTDGGTNYILYNPNGVKPGDKEEGRRRWLKAIQNKQKRVQEAILEATQGEYPGVKIADTEAAVKRAVISFWRGIVLNEKEYARDRLAAYTKIMEDAGLSVSDNVLEKLLQDEGGGATTDKTAEVLRQLNELIRQVKGDNREVVDGNIVE